MSKTSSRGVLWEVIAPVVRWPLHSPLRLVLVIVGALTAMCLLGAIGDIGDEEADQTSSSSTSSSSTSSTSSASTSPTSPSSSSSSSSSTSEPRTDHDHGSESTEELRARAKAAAPAVKVASSLADDLEKYRKASKAVWWKKVQPSLSKNGEKQLRSKSPSGVGFTKVTGKPRLLVTEVDMGPRYVNVGVPTDKGTYLFLVERTGKSWGVASVSKLTGPTMAQG